MSLIGKIVLIEKENPYQYEDEDRFWKVEILDKVKTITEYDIHHGMSHNPQLERHQVDRYLGQVLNPDSTFWDSNIMSIAPFDIVKVLDNDLESIKQKMFLEGFKASAEGYNGEHPPRTDEEMWESIKEDYDKIK